MTEYRLFFVAPQGWFDEVIWIIAPDDIKALDCAAGINPPHGGELWQRERLVGIVPLPHVVVPRARPRTSSRRKGA